MKDTVGGATLLYTTHGSSQWGRMVEKNSSVAPKHVWISVVKITSEQPLSAQEMNILNAKQLKNQSSAAATGIKGMPAQSQPQDVDFTAQAESPDIFDAILADGAEPAEPSSEILDVEEEVHKNKKRNIQEVSKVKGMANKLYISQLSCSEHECIRICNAADASNEKKTPSIASDENSSRCRQRTVTLPKSWTQPWQELNTTSYLLQTFQARTCPCHQLPQSTNRAGKPCSTCIHANDHQTPHSMSNMQTAKDNQSRLHDTSTLVAGKMTMYMDIRKCTSVTSTHTSVNNHVTPRRPIDAVKWHSTHMTVAVSHLYTSLESMIVPMLPSLKPDSVWIFADDLYIVHNGLLPSIEAPIHWHQHCHHTHVSGEVVQAVQTLTIDLRMQTRSLAEWEPTMKIVLQTCKHISLALIGLLFPCSVTVALQMLQALALTSTTLLQLTMQLIKAVPRERMQCSILHYLHKSECYVNSTLKQAHVSTKFLILFCDGLMLCISTGVDVREVQLYMNATEMICIAGLMIGILTLHLMSKYENLLMHATLNNQPTQLRKFDHPKCANGKY